MKQKLSHLLTIEIRKEQSGITCGVQIREAAVSSGWLSLMSEQVKGTLYLFLWQMITR